MQELGEKLDLYELKPGSLENKLNCQSAFVSPPMLSSYLQYTATCIWFRYREGRTRDILEARYLQLLLLCNPWNLFFFL